MISHSYGQHIPMNMPHFNLQRSTRVTAVPCEWLAQGLRWFRIILQQPLHLPQVKWKGGIHVSKQKRWFSDGFTSILYIYIYILYIYYISYTYCIILYMLYIVISCNKYILWDLSNQTSGRLLAPANGTMEVSTTPNPNEVHSGLRGQLGP